MPTKYSEPPTTRIQYIGMSLSTVSTKSGYARRPVSSKARHIRPCVMPGAVDGDDVEQDADGADPEVHLASASWLHIFRSGRGAAQPVDHAEGHEAVPAQGAGVHVGDGPVRVVRQALTLLMESIGPSKVDMP
jgi:hypothetical protein